MAVNFQGIYRNKKGQFIKDQPSPNKGKSMPKGENAYAWKGGSKNCPSRRASLICKRCGKYFMGRKGYLYCSDKCVREMRSEHRKKFYAENREKIRLMFGPKQGYRQQKNNRKEYYIKLKGDKCSACGIGYPIECYDFHHINPENKGNKPLGNTKRFKSLMAMRDDEIEREIKKVILLCANCHRIIHARLRDGDNDTQI